MEIRAVDAAERASVNLPLQVYAFQATPASDAQVAAFAERQRFYEGNLTRAATCSTAPRGYLRSPLRPRDPPP